ncbi:MAG TPA: hypothetical protein VMC81_07875, partial [Rhodocyclaceae bacterium]|nr:hypothetical protein [Rhodocyclaceae bacterium]
MTRIKEFGTALADSVLRPIAAGDLAIAKRGCRPGPMTHQERRVKLSMTRALVPLIGLGLASGVAWSAESLQDVMKRRDLSQQDLLAAAKTYVPTGKRDEFVAFSSGGQSGQIIVYGIPSMRILKYIGVFTPEPWQGYGYDEESKAVLAGGRIDGKDITWG